MTSTQRLANLIRNRFRVLLVGPPGTAKTARVIAAANLLGWRFRYGIDGRTADLMDRLDAAGAVVPDVAAGVSRSLPLQALKDIIESTEPTVWFVDEIGRAALDVQGALNAVFDLLKRNGSPVVVVAATNRPQDKAGVAVLSEQLRSRFDVTFAIATPDAKTDDVSGPTYLTDWAGEVAGWTDYAADAGFAPTVVAWHRTTGGSELYTWKPNANAALRSCDFRTWETVSRLVNSGITDVDSIGATIGRGPAAKFLAFAALASQLPAPSEVFASPDTAALPHEPAACYLISTVLARVVTPKQVPSFLTYIERLPRVFTALAARDVARRLDKQLVHAPGWAAWAVKNNALFLL
jgi:hypothetical protein